MTFLYYYYYYLLFFMKALVSNIQSCVHLLFRMYLLDLCYVKLNVDF